VYGTDQYYELLREKCMDYLVIMRRFFEPYIGENFDEYIKEKRKNQTWGDDIELEALSEIYSRPVEIYKGSDKPLKTFHENKYYSKYDTNSAINFTLYPIRLSYHKGNHYNSIIPLETDVENYKRYKEELEINANMMDSMYHDGVYKSVSGVATNTETIIPVGKYAFDSYNLITLDEALRMYQINSKYIINREITNDNETAFDVLFEPHFNKFQK